MFITETEIAVRYAETDKMGVVYHANYPIWCEVARTDFIEKAGFKYADMEAEGIISPVININLNYKQSVTYPEKVIVRSWIESYSKLRTVYGYEILNASGAVVADGTSTHVLLKRAQTDPSDWTGTSQNGM